jgi:hypothetical protein
LRLCQAITTHLRPRNRRRKLKARPGRIDIGRPGVLRIDGAGINCGVRMVRKVIESAADRPVKSKKMSALFEREIHGIVVGRRKLPGGALGRICC